MRFHKFLSCYWLLWDAIYLLIITSRNSLLARSGFRILVGGDYYYGLIVIEITHIAIKSSASILIGLSYI